MSRQNPERNIPHLRDIFGFPGGGGGSHSSPVDSLQNNFQDMKLNKNESSKDKGLGNDSAVSVGSTSEDEAPKTSTKKKKRASRRDGNRTITERDVKHLERHLSMKKTIRKKIMRDLQQAFVEDPNEFRVEDLPPEQLKAEISVQSITFGTPSKTGKKVTAESNFLDMLRSGGSNNAPSAPSGRFHDDDDSGHGSPPRVGCDEGDIYEADAANKKTSFWRRLTMKGRNKR